MRNLPLDMNSMLNVRHQLRYDQHMARTQPDCINSYMAKQTPHERWLMDIVDRMASPRKRNAAFVNAYKRRARNK